MPLKNPSRAKCVRKRLQIFWQYSRLFDAALTRIAINVKKYAFASGRIFITRHLQRRPEATSNIRHSKVRAKGNCGMLT